MKYTVATIVLVVLGALAIAAGSLESSRARQNALALQETVSRLSLQQLAGDARECRPPRWVGEPVNRDLAYCAEVWRELAAEPLQLVEIQKAPLMNFPTPSVRPALRKAPILTPAAPEYPRPDLGKDMFPSPSVG